MIAAHAALCNDCVCVSRTCSLFSFLHSFKFFPPKCNSGNKTNAPQVQISFCVISERSPPLQAYGEHENIEIKKGVRENRQQHFCVRFFFVLCLFSVRLWRARCKVSRLSVYAAVTSYGNKKWQKFLNCSGAAAFCWLWEAFHWCAAEKKQRNPKLCRFTEAEFSF